MFMSSILIKELVKVAVRLRVIDYTSQEELLSIQLNVPSQNESNVPKGAKIKCSDSNDNVVWQQNVTNFTTTLELDLERTVKCCISALTTSTKCITYNPDGTGGGKSIFV